MLAAEVASIIKQIPRPVRALGFWRCDERIRAVCSRRAACDIVLLWAGVPRGATAAERSHGGPAVDFDAAETGAIAPDREAFIDCCHDFDEF